MPPQRRSPFPGAVRARTLGWDEVEVGPPTQQRHVELTEEEEELIFQRLLHAIRHFGLGTHLRVVDGRVRERQS
ncbi:hypothetical protein ABZP36_017349 [Zizania latifolia]